MGVKIIWILNFVQYLAIILIDLFYVSYYKDNIRKIAHVLVTLTMYPGFLALVFSLPIALIPFSRLSFKEKWRKCFAYILCGILFFFLTGNLAIVTLN
jgi:hypothetical protein